MILLISELVTNAVVHTGCPAVLRMLLPDADAAASVPGTAAGAVEASALRARGAETVRVEVADRSLRPPMPRHAQGEETNGRGLELVDGLADRWGWRAEGAGKSIWCEVDRSRPALGVTGAYEPPCAMTNRA